MVRDREDKEAVTEDLVNDGVWETAGGHGANVLRMLPANVRVDAKHRNEALNFIKKIAT